MLQWPGAWWQVPTFLKRMLTLPAAVSDQSRFEANLRGLAVSVRTLQYGTAWTPYCLYRMAQSHGLEVEAGSL